MERLTKKQQEVYDFIKSYALENDVPPTVREIMEGVGLKSTSSIHFYMDMLMKKGYIVKVNKYSKWYRIVGLHYTEEPRI